MSISPESTDGEDITTDHHDQQENLGPTNLEPFEEMRLLLARIAELDRQMNSSTSSSASFDLVAQNKKEKHRLLVRLAQLEGQQTMNLPTSSDGFDFLTYDVNHVSLLATGLYLAKEELHQTNEKLKSTKESFDKKLEEQMEEVKRVAKLELENKALRAEHEELSTAHKNLMEEIKEQRKMDTLKQQKDQKEINDKIDSLIKDQQEQCANNLLEMIRGMEQKQKEELQRKMDESLKYGQAIVVAELEEQNQSNGNKFAEIEQKNALQQEKVIKLEKYQNEQSPNIVDLQKTVATLREIGLTPQQNRWDSTACHPSLALSELDRIIVQCNGENS
uniref:Uncharacterized protein n=1 Tax=Globodera pallida TaxID=36090 RepID=A0A183BZ45_GLOPA